MQYSRFVVDEIPYCVWDWDLGEVNRRFIKRIDGKYFDYLARANLEAFTEEDSQYAATAIRIGYHHGLETLFALLCAALQAPDCVVGWVQKYQLGQLRNLVRRIDHGGPGPLNKWKQQNITWSVLSDHINMVSYPDPKKTAETKRLYAQLWRRFSYDFLNESHEREYNSLKHGFRGSLGGFAIRMGIEEEYGVPAPESAMGPVMGSEFGTSFYVAEPIGGTGKSNPHFRVLHRGLNWRPEGMAQALQLISMSIRNVTSFLQIVNGEDPKTVPFHRPADSEGFDAPWSHHVSVPEFTMNTIIEETDIARLSKEDILKVYESQQNSAASE